jgi:hypothetical protein
MELEAVAKLAALLLAAIKGSDNSGEAKSPVSPGWISGASPVSSLGSPASSVSPTTGGDSSESLFAPTRFALLENILLALATVSSLKEEPRKQIIDARLLPRIVGLLAHPDPRIQAAACQCTMSLSRSVKNLRTSLVDAGVAGPLFKLLENGDTRAQVTASATICNIVLDFSPMKKTVLDSGIIPLLVRLTNSSDLALKLNAIWAIKNLSYRATSELKALVMRDLEWSRLAALLRDSDLLIREQAINVLRNLACGKEADIEEAFAGIGEAALFNMLETNLGVGEARDGDDTDMHVDEELPVASSSDIALQSLYVLANLATGSASHKAAVMRRTGLLQAVLRHMDHPRHPVRVASLWVVHNLTWPDDVGAVDRVSELRRFGFEERLKRMQADTDMEVKDKVKQALDHFEAVDLNGGDTVMTPVEGPGPGARGARDVTFGSLSGLGGTM